MTGKLRAFALGLALLAGGAWPIAGSPGIACAAGEGPRAVLVVDTGASVTRYCVALDSASVTGTRLIELASAQYDMPYSLGFGGQAVCMLHGVGPTGGDCWADYPNYWGYWHGGGGGWTWASGSAASYLVRDGAVEGWVWGSGDTPSTHAQPPPTRSSDVCEVVPSPTPSPGGGSGSGGSGGTGSGSGGPDAGGSDAGVDAGGSGTATPGDATATDGSSSADGSGTAGVGNEDDEPRRDERERSDTPTIAPDSNSDPTEAGDGGLRAAGSSVPAGGGPPLGMLLAIVIGVGLTAAGWRRIRTSGAGSAGEPR